MSPYGSSDDWIEMRDARDAAVKLLRQVAAGKKTPEQVGRFLKKNYPETKTKKSK